MDSQVSRGGDSTGTLGDAIEAGELVREGEFWTLAFRGRTVRLRDSKGVGYLSELLLARARSGHAHDQLAECPSLGDDREQRRFAHARIMERRETISSPESARGVLGSKESDDTRRSR